MVKLEEENKVGEFDIRSLIASARERAQDSYKYESGRRRAVEKGEISIEELAIYYFINDFVIHNSDGIDLYEDVEEVKLLEQRAYSHAAKGYNINEQKAQEIFEKVANMPKIYEG